MAGPTILSLFSGVGGLELGIRAVWPGARVLGYCERDAYAAAVLLARMEDETLEAAPVWCGDVRDVDLSSLRGRIDLVCGGIPCQPYSVAGKRRGNKDERALWPELARVVAECGPALVFIENVPGFVAPGAFRPLGEELCRLGYEIEDPVFLSAADVGAPHRRGRVFILAHTDSVSIRQQPWRSSGEGRENQVQHRNIMETSWPPGPEDGSIREFVNGLSGGLDESRTDQLRCCGNGVVPQQAAAALRELLRRIGGE